MEVNIHNLKTVQPYFSELCRGEKSFELRKDDRDYEVGDILVLLEYDPIRNKLTGEKLIRQVSHILRDAPDFGLMEGFCILSFEHIPTV